jgi:hypothetical protein
MTLRDLVRLKTRAQLLGAIDKYAAWCMGAVPPFGAMLKLRNHLTSGSVPYWAMVFQRYASSGDSKLALAKFVGKSLLHSFTPRASPALIQLTF